MESMIQGFRENEAKVENVMVSEWETKKLISNIHTFSKLLTM